MHLNLPNGFENSSTAATSRPSSGAHGNSEPASSLFPSARCRVGIYNLFGNACDKQTYSNVCEEVQSEMQEIKICLAAFAAGWMRRGLSLPRLEPRLGADTHRPAPMQELPVLRGLARFLGDNLQFPLLKRVTGACPQFPGCPRNLELCLPKWAVPFNFLRCWLTSTPE